MCGEREFNGAVSQQDLFVDGFSGITVRKTGKEWTKT